MCGIVGYIGTREAYPILIKGLHRLEYRGYDSAGVALLNSAGELNVFKSKGKVTRINTNGQANLIHKQDVTDVIVTSCDVINISLNECNAIKYQAHCKSIYGEKAFDALLEFATLCLQKGGNVVFSVVDSIGYADIEACKKLAEKVGVPLRVRAKE